MFKYILPMYPTPDSKTGDWQIKDLESLASYEEFNGPDVVSHPNEIIPAVPGVPLKHQHAVSRLMSGHSNINGLMLIHEVGTGKTCSAISSIEINLADAMFGTKRGLVLVPNPTVQRNFKRELIESCTTKYNADSEIRNRVHKELIGDRYSKTLPKQATWKTFYTFVTFERFAKYISEMTDASIVAKWNSTFVVIDEAHTIGRRDSKRYVQIDRFLRLLPNKKILLLTGTPVRDNPTDFAVVFNLLLENGQKLEVDGFLARYLPPPAYLPSQELISKLAGKVSYLSADPSDIEIVHAGQPLPGRKTHIVSSVMSNFQASVYIQALIKSRQEVDNPINGSGLKKGDVAYMRVRQATRFVFPDGSYGSEGYNKYMPGDRPTREFITALTTVYRDGEAPRQVRNDEERYEAIARYSQRYADLARSVIEAGRRSEKSLVYDDLIRGSGLFVFACILELFGMRRGRNNAASLTYELLTGDMSDAQISEVQKSFNEPTNARGRYLMCILGSRVISVGLTFKDVMHEHVVAHWNDSETRQVIGRGIRAGSHKAIQAVSSSPGKVRVTIYRHASKYPASDDPMDSIDLMMYDVSEKKRALIDAVVNAARDTALTCRAFAPRNHMNPSRLDPSTNLPWTNEMESCSIPENLTPLNAENSVATEMWDSTRLKIISKVLVDMRMGTLETFAEKMREAGMTYDPYVDIAYVLHLIRNGATLNPDDDGPRLIVHDMDGVLYVSRGVDIYGDSFMSQYTSRFVHARPGTEQNLYENYMVEISDGLLSKRISRGDFPETWEIPPKVVQSLIQDSVTTRLLGPDMTVPGVSWATVDAILDKYKDFWTGPDEIVRIMRLERRKDEPIDLPEVLAAVWYEAGVGGGLGIPRVLTLKDFRNTRASAYTLWKYESDEPMLKILVRIRDFRRLDKENTARNNKLDYVGTVNPTSGDFCLSGLTSNVKRIKGRVDRRNLLVGKKCNYYSKRELGKIYATMTNADQREIDSMTRVEMCNEIRKRYRDLNLTSLDMSCGVQNKKR